MPGSFGRNFMHLNVAEARRGIIHGERLEKKPLLVEWREKAKQQNSFPFEILRFSSSLFLAFVLALEQVLPKKRERHCT